MSNSKIPDGFTVCKVCNLSKPVDEFNIMKLDDGVKPLACAKCEARTGRNKKVNEN